MGEKTGLWLGVVLNPDVSPESSNSAAGRRKEGRIDGWASGFGAEGEDWGPMAAEMRSEVAGRGPDVRRGGNGWAACGSRLSRRPARVRLSSAQAMSCSDLGCANWTKRSRSPPFS